MNRADTLLFNDSKQPIFQGMSRACLLVYHAKMFFCSLSYYNESNSNDFRITFEQKKMCRSLLLHIISFCTLFYALF